MPGPLDENFVLTPHLLRFASRPVTLAVANVLAGIAVAFFAIEWLGGYSLEHIAHPTALSNALEWIGTVCTGLGFVAAVVFAVLHARPRVRWLMTGQLVAWWPAQVALVLWAHALKY